MQRMLASSVARMQRPLLVACVSKWKYVWGRNEKREGRMSGLTQAERVVAEARLEAQAVVGALERALAEEKEEGKQRLNRLRLELTGSASDSLAAQQARATREKEERVEAIAQRAVKRIKHGGILRGWTSWFDMWSEKVRMQRMLASSVARMQRPLLVACVSKWKYIWGEAELREGRMSGLTQAPNPNFNPNPNPNQAKPNPKPEPEP